MQSQPLNVAILASGAVLFLLPRAAAQPLDPPAAQPESKRILGIIPNFRTANLSTPYRPLTSGEKFTLAARDSFDPGTVALGLVFGAMGQLTRSNPSFGNGGAGYARYAAASYGDLVIGNFMTEAIYPSLLHQDPRYFRRGTGSGWSRLGYAMGQIFRCRRDAGGTVFNYSEILGNATAVAISNAYYPDHRTAQDAVSKLGTQIGLDMSTNVLKEFWPDLRQKLHLHLDH